MSGSTCRVRGLVGMAVLLVAMLVPATVSSEPSVRILEVAEEEAIIGVVAAPVGARVELVPRRPALRGTADAGGPRILGAPDFMRVRPGLYEVSVRLSGYEPQATEVSIGLGQAALVEAVLEPTFRILRTEEAEQALALPYGVYHVEKDEAGTPIGIRPRFPQQELLEFFELAVPLSLGATVAFSVLDLARPPDNTPPVPVLTLAGQGLTLGLAGGSIALRKRRDEFFAAYDPPDIVLRRDAAERLYERAREAANDGRIEEAARLADDFLRLHEASDRVPLVHLQRARLALAAGDARAAERDLRLIRSEYHDLRVYDEAGVLLAEVLRGRGEHEAALTVLADAPVLAGGTYEPAEVSFQRLLSLWELAGDADAGSGSPGDAPSGGFAETGIGEAEGWLAEYGGTPAGSLRGPEVRCMLIDLYETAGRGADARRLWNASQPLPGECAPQLDGESPGP